MKAIYNSFALCAEPPTHPKAFLERIEKPVHKNGPPLTTLHGTSLTLCWPVHIFPMGLFYVNISPDNIFLVCLTSSMKSFDVVFFRF